MELTGKCLCCSGTLKGRIDKKFCNDYCRTAYHNQLKSPINNHIKNVNNALGKNRRIMETILTRGETTRITREKMIQMGFQFKYLTHTYTTRKGRTYNYCYDHGYLPLENDWFLIVRGREF